MSSLSADAVSITKNSSGASQLWYIVSVCTLGVSGNAGYFLLPLMVGAASSRLGFSDQQVGWTGSIEMLGMMAGALFASWTVKFNTPRKFAALGLCCIALSFLFSLQATDFSSYASSRLLGGVGGGLCVSLAFICTGYTAAADRNVGVLNAVLTLLGSLSLMFFDLVLTRFGLGYVFALLSLQLIIGLLLLPWLPQSSDRPIQVMDAVAVAPAMGTLLPANLAFMSIFSLVATVAAHLAPSGQWTYSEHIAISGGVTADQVGILLVPGTLVCAVSSFFSWKLSARVGQQRALLMATIGMLIVMLSWLLPLCGIAGFAARSIGMFGFWGVLSTYQITAVSQLDGNGRFTALVPAAQSLGLTLGPMFVAMLVGAGMKVEISLSLVGVSLLLPVLVQLWISRVLAVPASPSMRQDVRTG